MDNETVDRENWKARGYLTSEEVDHPPREVLKGGAVAVIECPQRIPCDPCSESCPVGAIDMENVNSLPKVDYGKCTGCGICVENCPGLAIFTLDCSGQDTCQITLPYEFPLPEAGEEVEGLNRKGEAVSNVTVTRVKPKDRSVGDTSTVTVAVPEESVHDIRNIRRKE